MDKIYSIGFILIIIILLIVIGILNGKNKPIKNSQIVKDIFCKLDKLKINPTKDLEYNKLKEQYFKEFNLTIKNCRSKPLIPN